MEEKSTQTSRSLAVLIIIVSLVAVSAIVPAKWLGGAPKKQLKPKIDLSSISLVEEVATDSNHDGVVSWKEVMADTLHASTSTLEELKKIPVDQKDIDTLNDPNNLTSSFAKNLYLTGAYFEKNGITDEASKQEVLTKLMQDEKVKIVPTIYGYKDFNVAKTESKDSMRAYGNALGAILENIITKKSTSDDILSVMTYTNTKIVKDLDPVRESKKRLEVIVEKLLKVSVPPSAVVFHTTTVNRVTAYRDILRNMSSVDTDPLRATFVVDTYPAVAVATMKIFVQLSDYFNNQNIVFSSKEKGYIFTVGYPQDN